MPVYDVYPSNNDSAEIKQKNVVKFENGNPNSPLLLAQYIPTVASETHFGSLGRLCSTVSLDSSPVFRRIHEHRPHLFYHLIRSSIPQYSGNGDGEDAISIKKCPMDTLENNFDGSVAFSRGSTSIDHRFN